MTVVLSVTHMFPRDIRLCNGRGSYATASHEIAWIVDELHETPKSHTLVGAAAPSSRVVEVRVQ